MYDDDFISELAYEFLEDAPDVFVEVVMRDQKLARKVVKKLVELVIEDSDSAMEIAERVLKAHRDKFIVFKKTEAECREECDVESCVKDCNEECEGDEKCIEECKSGCEDCVEDCIEEEIVQIPEDVNKQILQEIAEKLIKWVMRQ